MLPVIIQAASLIVLFLKKGGCFLKRFECSGKSRGFFIDKQFHSGYYVSLCQVGSVSIKEGSFSNSTFPSTLFINEIGVKA